MIRRFLESRANIVATMTLAAIAFVGCGGCGGSSNPAAQAPEKFAPAPTEEPPVMDAGSPTKRGDAGTREAEVLTLPGRGGQK